MCHNRDHGTSLLCPTPKYNSPRSGSQQGGMKKVFKCVTVTIWLFSSVYDVLFFIWIAIIMMFDFPTGMCNIFEALQEWLTNHPSAKQEGDNT